MLEITILKSVRSMKETMTYYRSSRILAASFFSIYRKNKNNERYRVVNALIKDVCVRKKNYRFIDLYIYRYRSIKRESQEE